MNKTDPTGAVVTCSDKDTTDCSAIAKSINSLSRTQYKFNKVGRLVVDRSAQRNSAGSRHYSSRLNQAIAAKGQIDIRIEAASPSGRSVEESGGGNTNTPGKPGPVTVTVSGKEGHASFGPGGDRLDNGPQFVLMHELVGHSIPRIAGSDTGNAIDNENRIRDEVTPGKVRARDPSHIEYYPFESWENP